MSSPAGLQQSQSNFLARWMPNSSRAGVILNPSHDLAESLRNSSVWGSRDADGDDDSFASQFAPLPASTSSSTSCLSVDLLVGAEAGMELNKLNQRPGERTLSDKPLAALRTASQGFLGDMANVEEMVNQSQDMPLMLKLEQLKQWQQQMQEQLKAHQLEELVRLQEEQQRLLGMVHGDQHDGPDYTQSPRLTRGDWDESSLLGGSPLSHRDTVSSPTTTTSYRRPAPQSFPQAPPQGSVYPQSRRQGNPLSLQPRGREEKEELETTLDELRTETWRPRHRDQKQSVDSDDEEEQEVTMVSHAASSMTDEDHTAYRGEEGEVDLEERPIQPGIGGQKRTFEELLEEQLRLEEQRLKSAHQQQSPEPAEGARANPKRAFLKRGEGLSRFTNRGRTPPSNRGGIKKDSKPQQPPQAKVNTRWTSEPKSTQRTSTTGPASQRPPVQRKTAILNKENRSKDALSPPLQGKAAQAPALVRPRVLGSHQRHNIEMTASTQPNGDVRQQQQQQQQQQPGQLKDAGSGKAGFSSQPVTVSRPGTRGLPPSAVTKQVGLEEGKGTLKTGNIPSSSRQEMGRPASGGGGGGGGGGVVDPEYSFELSLQEKLQRWDCDRMAESVELGEFELLEQAADELSFSSNSSFVQKVLQMDQQHQQHLFQGTKGRHLRRLSSTPIKSPRPSPPKGVISGGCGGMVVSKPISSEPEASAAVKARGDPLMKKSKASDDDDDDESKQDVTDVSFHSSSEFGDQEVAGPQYAPPHKFPGNLCFASSNPPYDRRSYQDRDGEGGSGQAEGDGEGESDSFHSNPDDSTLLEDKEVDRQGHMVFDDNDTWNDPEVVGGGIHDDNDNNDIRRSVSPFPTATANDDFTVTRLESRTLKRKVAVATREKGAESERSRAVTAANQEVDPPPTSQLMARLFPSLKPQPQPASAVPPPPQPEKRWTENQPGQQQQQQQSRQLRERLVELEMEIERFKTENAALARLRLENDQNQENLRTERAEFEQRKGEELARFEEYRKEETRKLQKERKVFEKHASAARAIPDKKERDEIQALKQQLCLLQEELKRRESRWSTTHSRLRQQMDSLSGDNAALRDEVHTLERLRLNTWKKGDRERDGERERPRPPERDGEGERREKEREAPRPPESCSTLVTRGVKFSSPPETAKSSLHQSSSTSTTRGSSPGGSLRRSGPSPAPLHQQGSEERPGSGTRSQDTPPRQDHSHNLSPRTGDLPTEEEMREVKDQGSSQEVIKHPDGKVERVLPCGGRLIVFPNGTRKEVSADGQMAKVTFFNGDTKQVLADHRVIYYYADAQTTHTTYPDGMEVLQFPTSQTEKHFPDGRKEITFPDQTVKNLYPDGREESVLTDGTIILMNTDGSKEIQFNTGQKEVHTAQYKRREYPDGTVKTVYTDGRQETRYPTGRVRVKDRDGNIVMDNKL